MPPHEIKLGYAHKLAGFLGFWKAKLAFELMKIIIFI